MRAIQLLLVFCLVNLLVDVAAPLGRLQGVPATEEEAMEVRGACIAPAYGTQSACGNPHWLGGAGWDFYDNYTEQAGFLKPSSPPCSCSGTYVGFSEDLCIGE
jgi:hypothetical protein